MVQGLLTVAMLALSYGVVNLVLGKDVMERRKQEGKNNIPLVALVFALLLIWALSLIFLTLGSANEDFALCIATVIGVPILLAVIGYVMRRNQTQ